MRIRKTATRLTMSNKLWQHPDLRFPIVPADAIGELNCDVRIGARCYGDSFETYTLIISATRADFQRIAVALVACALGAQSELYIPIHADCHAKGIQIVAATLPSGQPNSFTYTPKRKLKRYPWYPWSLSCDALTELPTFGIVGVPGERDHLLWDGRRDLSESYSIWIGGYPKGLIRLARLLLDYANTDIPPEEIDLEIEGGFRGVGPYSYEARFERVDN